MCHFRARTWAGSPRRVTTSCRRWTSPRSPRGPRRTCRRVSRKIAPIFVPKLATSTIWKGYVHKLQILEVSAHYSYCFYLCISFPNLIGQKIAPKSDPKKSRVHWIATQYLIHLGPKSLIAVNSQSAILIAKEDGFLSLWRGLNAGLAYQVVMNGTRLTLFDFMKDHGKGLTLFNFINNWFNLFN